MGFKEAGLRGSLRNVSVGADVIPDSGISRWTFDNSDTDSGTALDSWGSNDGTINGATTGVSGANQTYTTNEAYDFDGSDDNVATPVTLTATASYALWVSPNDTSDGRFIATRNGTNGADIRINSGNFQAYVYAGGSFQVITGNAVTADTWTHLCFAIDDGNEIILYEDGSQVAQTGIGSRQLGDEVYIGSGQGGGFNVNSIIDDPRVFDKALTSTEVSNLYSTGSISG